MIKAIIPLKGNSERVKDKNIRNLAGRPLFFHIISTLKIVEGVEKVIINTDSDLISSMAQSEFGDFVDISMRTDSLCGDFVSVNKIINYELDRLRDTNDQVYIQTHATNPLLSSITIDNALKLFEKQYLEKSYDSMFSVTEYFSRFYTANGVPVNHDPNELIRTQDLSPVLEENSNFYIFTKKSFKKNEKRIADKPSLFHMKAIEALDIDTEDDWQLVENLIDRKIKMK